MSSFLVNVKKQKLEIKCKKCVILLDNFLSTHFKSFNLNTFVCWKTSHLEVGRRKFESEIFVLRWTQKCNYEAVIGSVIGEMEGVV